ncbi:MAG: class I SAM-dependent rRNA methyltransferase, partial [Owenweeksia sp.]
HHAGWTPFLHLIQRKLTEKLVKFVYYKPADKMDQSGKGWLTQKPDDGHEVMEYGHRFQVDWEEGQKTGFFLDQRENRKKLADFATGRTVLNTFSYTGGFSIYALKAGAQKVVSVDISQAAIDLANENARLNGLSEKHTGITSDVLQYLKSEGGNFDIIILDPPAFSKSRRTIHNAVQGYKRLNSKAISEIKSGGLIFTFSCSQHMTAQLFEDTIRAAAIEAGRPVRIVERLGQPADHPVNIYHPEGAYLKGLILAVD